MFSKALLQNRQARRRVMAQLLLVVLVLLVLGNWPLRDWLGESWLRFMVWWGGVGFLTIWMMLLAIYDASRLRKEILEEDEDL